LYEILAEMRDDSNARGKGRPRMDPVQFKNLVKEVSRSSALDMAEGKKEQEYQVSCGAADSSEAMEID
jgi:hypothetical protein